jgi:acyl-CoA thioester hydrolase
VGRFGGDRRGICSVTSQQQLSKRETTLKWLGMKRGTETDHFEQRFCVGWSDLDGNAHMGNSSFLDHAANTRMLFFAHRGFTLARFAAEKFGPVMARDELVYRKELRLMDEFTVDLELVGISDDGVRFRVRNTFRNAANELAATVTSDGVWFDLERRRPRVPPPDLDAMMRALRRTDDFAEIPSKKPSGTA